MFTAGKIKSFRVVSELRKDRITYCSWLSAGSQPEVGDPKFNSEFLQCEINKVFSYSTAAK